MNQVCSFKIRLVRNEIVLEQIHPIRFTPNSHYKLYTYVRAGIRIGTSALAVEKPLKGNATEIIQQIHAIRYNANNPYVITGGHFYQIFVRNLGVFFNALLDPRIPSSPDDWYLRQSIALRTVAHDVEVFKLAGREYTTITPVRKHLYTGLNLYARPSDSLHAIVYTLNALLDDTFIETIFPAKSKTKHQLQTQKAAKKLLIEYKKTLTALITTYKDDTLDTSTGLIRKDILLASARDGIKRQSSFYDNVILWSTLRLAAKLGLYEISDQELADWKEHLLKSFWDKEKGIFFDDLSIYSQKNHIFSADSFIVTSTQFFDVKKKRDRLYLLQMVAYVKKYKLDKPFPLHYSTIDLPNNLYRPVKYFAPAYMGTSIWCHWGMEYIKALIYLSKYNPQLLSDAKKHLKTYKKNIETYGGYPEVYDKNGKILKTRLYRSVLHNGWVINYEQANMLLNAVY